MNNQNKFLFVAISADWGFSIYVNNSHHHDVCVRKCVRNTQYNNTVHMHLPRYIVYNADAIHTLNCTRIKYAQGEHQSRHVVGHCSYVYMDWIFCLFITQYLLKLDNIIANVAINLKWNTSVIALLLNKSDLYWCMNVPVSVCIYMWFGYLGVRSLYFSWYV